MTILGDVKALLKKYTADIQADAAKIDEIEAKIKSEKFNDYYVNNELRPRIRQLKTEISRKQAACEAEMHKLTAAHKDTVRESDRLRGDQMTDDARLFTCGVKLTPTEIETVFDRHANNPTMQQLAIRYAKENGIDIGRVYISPAKKELEGTEAIEHAGKMYIDKWINSDKAGKMLDAFFPE